MATAHSTTLGPTTLPSFAARMLLSTIFSQILDAIYAHRSKDGVSDSLLLRRRRRVPQRTVQPLPRTACFQGSFIASVICFNSRKNMKGAGQAVVACRTDCAGQRFSARQPSLLQSVHPAPPVSSWH